VQQYAIAGDYVKSVGCGLTCLDKLYGISVSMTPSATEVADIYSEVKQALLALPSVYLMRLYYIMALRFQTSTQILKYIYDFGKERLCIYFCLNGT
jgi:hypothetical protein